ncbi:unnamed protein product [Effrenium voratum]|uniref:Glycoside hydrolase family 5 domain-containing protein n=1 Tax=Effrenium voratum TaxID=2562239 RepID=A0AA36NG74_9DINO|nr:unnamed protein product [Effrenium voratum]
MEVASFMRAPCSRSPAWFASSVFQPSLGRAQSSPSSPRTHGSLNRAAVLAWSLGLIKGRRQRTSRRAADRLRIAGRHLVDEEGRIVLPRGINFSGLSKVPRVPEGATHLGGPSFYEHREVSFVGRPCPLERLEEHLNRLRGWGFTLLRLVITWEAVEHAGVGEYDLEYLQYLKEVCSRAGEKGFWVIIDPHQDCWSRWTGGDGAPGWTLEAAGFRLGPELHSSGAAFLHQEHGDPLPSMSWPTNYDKLACATMFSLFWAGDLVAPGVQDNLNQGQTLQQLLQGSFLAAMAQVARTLREVPCVLGFETMNEPHPGWLGRGTRKTPKNSRSAKEPQSKPDEGKGQSRPATI